jgi:hypothetical protein
MVAVTLTRMGRPRKSEPSEPVRVPQSFLKRVRRVATHLDMDPGDYIAEKLGQLLRKDEAKMLEDIEREREDQA